MSENIISYLDMCQREGTSLQRGMNFKLNPHYSVLLMSVRPGAPYADLLEADGTILIYEGHDTSKRPTSPDPKTIDQPLKYPSGKLTQNGLFFEAARQTKENAAPPEAVKVYEKIKDGIWSYNGLFQLVDAWLEEGQNRTLCKFKLIAIQTTDGTIKAENTALPTRRLIPSAVKQAVWKRDGGKCVLCSEKDQLHFDHIVPYSKGGTSLVADNIQLLCARHNLSKSARIE